MDWFLPLVTFFSLSVRTPNVEPNLTDYEISIGIEKVDQLYLNQQWERELGIEYKDQEYWIKKTLGSFSFKERYVDKTSKGIQFNQFDTRYERNGYSGGTIVKYSEEEYTLGIVAGYAYDSRVNIFLLGGQATTKIDIMYYFGQLDYLANLKLKFEVLTNLDVYLQYNTERINDDGFFNGKIGVEFEIPLPK